MKYLLFVVCLLPIAVMAQNDKKLIYKNSSLSTSARVNDLLSRMTLQQKIGQLNLITFVNENNSTNPLDNKVMQAMLAEF
ncbi:hypothetical protein EZ456_06715 [Pedobacter psychrodurus]|uniref:Beta-glucosidase n=1 Tax=Pedobacter psychrodurus TaxID=2530456 RepID=A0A4R0Q471_9SPHI|nr:hypothetical protein [Pedobacter psychrodurus]TCD28368.1 hypothetical protein EZ456_06715 [Pedobacter psychrodurus]